MSFFSALLSQVFQGDEFTNGGHQIFGVVGDSNADGRGVTIPTVSAGVLYLFNGTSFDEITTQAVANAGDYGSIWQQFATDYNADTGYKVNIVNGASGGAEFYPNGDNNNWYTSGDLYSAFTTDMAAALAARGIQKPRAIFINCGINDVRGGTSNANITTGVSSLVSRLKTDYPGTPLVFIQIGRSETSAITANLIDARQIIIDQCESDSDCFIGGSALGIIGAGQYNGDNLHYSTEGCNTIGSQLVRWFKNSSYTNKWVRAIISCHFDELSTVRKNLINSKIGGIYTRGDYFKIAQYLNFVTTTVNNCWVDFAFLGYGFNGSVSGHGDVSFTANTYITTDGSSSFLTPSYVNGYYSITGQDDFLVGIDVETFSTAGGVLSFAFGGSDGTSQYYLRQTASNTVQFMANDATASTGSGTAIADNSFIAVARNGGTKYQLTETTQVSSALEASTGQVGVLLRIGVFNNNGSLGFWSEMNVRCFIAAKYSDLDSQTITDLLDIGRHWND